MLAECYNAEGTLAKLWNSLVLIKAIFKEALLVKNSGVPFTASIFVLKINFRLTRFWTYQSELVLADFTIALFWIFLTVNTLDCNFLFLYDAMNLHDVKPYFFLRCAFWTAED